MDPGELALECRRTAEDILAFLAGRPDGRDTQAHGDRLIAQTTALHDEFAVRFSDRLQHLIIRLSAAGFPTDKLEPLSYAGTDRLGARAAAATLMELSDELIS